MLRVLAHRGLWRLLHEQNSIGALAAAVERGLGFETDLRDREGGVVVAHDPAGREAPSLATLFAALPTRPPAGVTCAWNIKADGLATRLVSELPEAWHAVSVFFDMSVPDMASYVAHGLPVLARHSDVEPAPAYLERAVGVWLDELEGPWIDAGVLGAHLNVGRQVIVVSPELHGRDPRAVWHACRSFRESPGLSICTDRVDDVLAVMS